MHDLLESSIRSSLALPTSTSVSLLSGSSRVIRTYRPLDLTVGARSVQIESEVGAAVEKKIDLPDSWVRGLVEVQSALMLSPVNFSLSPAFVADIVARLEAEKENTAPGL